MRPLPLTVLVFVTLIAQGAFGAMCPSTTLTDTDRATMANKHNALRSTLAQGRAQTQIGFAPAGKNIYKLQWDCTLEASAQAWANTCKFEHSVRNDVGENLMLIGGSQPTSALLTGAADSWWSELREFGISDSRNILTPAVFDRGVGHFTQMAWGNTKKLGCGVAKCGTSNLIVCHYGPSGNYLYEPIYQLGAACKLNSECTTYPGSACNVIEGLCVDPAYKDITIDTPGGISTSAPNLNNRCSATEMEQPSKALCLSSPCTLGYTCKYSAVALNYICCAPAPNDCSSTDVLMYYGGTMPVYCPILGNTGQCMAPYSYCMYSPSWRQNVCCRQNIGK
uniref:SCP domain-containing protein n=1 Tax=Plectus sambesii TaxID=2011161 RepID=A0A914W113_9BILA